MKNTVIGGLIMFGGLLITLTIISVAMTYIPSISSWSGSRLWTAIFGKELFLGFPFLVGLLMTIFGLAILVMEYIEKPFLKFK